MRGTRAVTGEYGWEHNVLYILERDSRLFALIEWFGLYPLEQVDADHLRFPPYGLYAGVVLRIVRDCARVADSDSSCTMRTGRGT